MYSNGRGAGASDVAHAWAHQLKDEKRKGNVFFIGKTIYSYGHHFPIATLLDDNHVLFTRQTYSNSTTNHVSTVKAAASHKTIIYCWHVPDNRSGKLDKWDHDRNITEWKAKVKEKLEDIAGRRQQRTRDRLMSELHHLHSEAKAYIDYFKLKLSKDVKRTLFSVDFEGFVEGVRAVQAEEKRKRDELIRQGEELHPVWLEAWRNNSEWEHFDKHHSNDVKRRVMSFEYADGNRNKVRLRVIGDTIHTSKGVNIPVGVAYKYYMKYLKMVEKGGCCDNCGYKMMSFEVKEMNADRLLVGCHDIARSEIDYIAAKLGWVENPGSYGLSVDAEGNIAGLDE